MAGSRSSNIFSSSSVLSCALATLMVLSILHVLPKAQAEDHLANAEEEEAKCLTLLAEVPGSKDYCTGFPEPSSSSPSSSIEMGYQWGQDLEQCWSSLMSIQGCVGSIFFALVTGNFSKVGQECCQAIEFIAAECWLKIFPWNPMFPTLLLGSCKKH